MSTKRIQKAVGSTLIDQLVLNRDANSKKVSETGFTVDSILGPIDAAIQCGFQKPIMIANTAGVIHWVNFSDGSLVTIASGVNGVSAKKVIVTAVDGVTANVSGVTGTVSSAASNFTTAGVQAGDLLVNASGGADDGTFTILSVDTAHQVTVDTTVHGAFVGLAAQSFTIDSIHVGTFTSAGAAFIADLVHVGDTLTIANGADAGSYAVVSIDGATQLTVNTAAKVGGFVGVAAETYTVKTINTPPTDFTNGIMIPPNSVIMLASGTKNWVRSDSTAVGAYVCTEFVIRDGDQQQPVSPNTNPANP